MPTPGEHKTVQARILAYAGAEGDLILIDYKHFGNKVNSGKEEYPWDRENGWTGFPPFAKGGSEFASSILSKGGAW
jgi:hypothetical protein